MSSPINLNQVAQLARLKHGQGALDEAIALYGQLVRVAPRNSELLQLMGVAHLQKGELDQAANWLRKANKIDPRSPSVLANLGAVYRRQGFPRKAVQACLAAAKAAPAMANAHFNLARAYHDLEEFDSAIASYECVIALTPNDSDAYLNLGVALLRTMDRDPPRWRRAMSAFERVLRLQPASHEAYANIGHLLLMRGWIHAALAFYDKGAAANPSVKRLRYLRSAAHLILGHVGEGWDDYEFRTETDVGPRIARRPPPPPYWNGEDLSGRRIYVWSEQGLGDQVIYANCVPDLIARAGHVYIESKPRLTAVFGRSFPAATVLGRKAEDEHVPAPPDADYQVSLGSLGKFFRRALSDFPRHQGYLRPDPRKVERFRQKYSALASGRRIVGLSWRSQNALVGHEKSAEILGWGDVLQVPGVWWVNLQYGDCAADLAAVKAKLGVDVYQDAEVDPMGDLDDFFAQVAALDLLVSTSNTAVHVAGSQNVPTWIILPKVGGTMWYWFLDRSDSPWYPSVRLFRESGERPAGTPWWRDVVKRVGADLKNWSAGGELGHG